MYRQDSLVDITLKVCDLFIPNTDIWDKEKVRETLTPEDAERVLRLKPSLSRLDSDVWGLTKHIVILRRVPINFSQIPPPRGGFSPDSTFLNLHYLVACTKKRNSELGPRHYHVLLSQWKRLTYGSK
ncbi:hypothetical protein DY000_02022741 [Brassica cretica]|uniref:Uncharacterized protein n=1 Tax=Brassica cretica TaxID=69181 RepID=A0ABQ7EC18_BRACR|nr:hypothetical protein DY000_02022741 [Brassica cretica]